jgi:hypothetical protein
VKTLRLNHSDLPVPPGPAVNGNVLQLLTSPWRRSFSSSVLRDAAFDDVEGHSHYYSYDDESAGEKY